MRVSTRCEFSGNPLYTPPSKDLASPSARNPEPAGGSAFGRYIGAAAIQVLATAVAIPSLALIARFAPPLLYTPGVAIDGSLHPGILAASVGALAVAMVVGHKAHLITNPGCRAA